MGWPEKDLGDVSKFPRIKADFTKPQGAKAVVDAFVSAGYDAAEVELDAGNEKHEGRGSVSLPRRKVVKRCQGRQKGGLTTSRWMSS